MYRNPSPPPLEKVGDNVDRIGETAYSQCWLLKALVSLSSQTIKEDEVLSEEFENEFCQLWDMSSDKQVGKFMLDKGVCDMVLAPLVRSTNYRVREVSLGIIANLMCHSASAKIVTEHSTLRTFIPTLMREDDVSVLTETVRLLRAALVHQPSISDEWCKVLPDDTVERLIHIIQSTLNMSSVRSNLLTEHCAHMLEILYYRDDTLLSHSAYTVFPIVDILQSYRNCRGVEEPLLRCLQYLCEEERAVDNMTQCPGLPKVIHCVMSEKLEYGLAAVCLSLICTLLTSSATDDMCAWLEKDCIITDTAIRTLNRIIYDDSELEKEKQDTVSGKATTSGHSIDDVTALPTVSIDGQTSANEAYTHVTDMPPDGSNLSQQNENTNVANGHAEPEHRPGVEKPSPPTIETPTPKSVDRLTSGVNSPIRLVTPTYGTPSAVPTPTSMSNVNTPQSTLSTPYSVQRRVPYTPSERRYRRATSEPSRPVIQVCREMAWNFLYTLANHIPQEGSCVLKYVSDCIKDLISCFESDGDKHVELGMLYKQHLDKYPHFSKSCSLLGKYITCHTTTPDNRYQPLQVIDTSHSR